MSTHWLDRAEAAYRSVAVRGARATWPRREGDADLINSTLSRLGITPLTAACAPQDQNVVLPALLLKPDPERMLHGVRAELHKPPLLGKTVVLTACHPEARLEDGERQEEVAWQYACQLKSLEDVAIARHEGEKAETPAGHGPGAGDTAPEDVLTDGTEHRRRAEGRLNESWVEDWEDARGAQQLIESVDANTAAQLYSGASQQRIADALERIADALEAGRRD